MKQLTLDDQQSFRYEFSADDTPVETINPGDTITVETEDAYEGQIREDGDRRDRKEVPRSNPLCGPIEVRDTEPGDVIAVTIRDIDPLRGQASTYVPSWWSYQGSTGTREAIDQFVESGWENVSTILPIEDGEVIFSETIRLPYNPMIGTIGTAPAQGSVSNGTPGPYGGNMDLTCFGEGSTIYLPVNVPGGFLYVGDAHALQGEGEITLVAGEMPATTTMTVDVRSELSLNWPRIETDEYIFAVAGRSGFGTLDDTIRLAFLLLAEWLTEYDINKLDAWQLCGLHGRLVLGNISCAAAGFPKSHLPKHN